MPSHAHRFGIFMLVSLLAFIIILRWVTRRRPVAPSLWTVVWTPILVVVGGMLFAKLGQNSGWPWWIYYSVPAAATIALPPVTFRMSAEERWRYWVLAAMISPVIHVAFSLILGWKDYMPFIPVPSIRELLG